MGFDAQNYHLANPLILSKAANVSLVLFSEPEAGKLILLFADIIGLDNGGKYGETVSSIKHQAKVVPVNASHLLRGVS